jgi:hypothetical protein
MAWPLEFTSVNKPSTTSMKTFGIILIVAGLLMLVYKGFNVQTEKKVVDIGPVEINKKENRWIGWPTYGGATAIAAGVLLFIADKKKIA